jgi:hypothetical protein
MSLEKEERWKRHELRKGAKVKKTCRISVNQVSACWNFIQSGYTVLEFQPIRWFHHRTVVQSGFLMLEIQAIRSFHYLAVIQSRFCRLGVQPVRFLQTRSSSNQMISLSDFHPNQIFSGWEFSELGNFTIRPSSNQIFPGWVSNQSGDFTMGTVVQSGFFRLEV